MVDRPGAPVETPPQTEIEALAALYHQGRLDAVVQQAEALIGRYPESFLLWNALGAANAQLGRLDQALRGFRQACALNPNYADAHNNLGIALKKQGALALAAQSYRRALALNPENAEAHNNLAIVLQALGEPAQAIASYKRALAINLDYPHAEAQMLYQRRQIADWENHDDEAAAYARLGVETSAIPPFLALAMEDHPERQLIRSLKYAKAYVPHVAPAPFARRDVRPERLRIGYFTADFQNHATLLLMTGLFREHDRSKFEVFGYGCGQVASGGLSERAQGLLDTFRDVSGFSDHAIAALARDDKLDIAIDLKGYTTDSRSEIFARRLAPIQINFLGFPGSMGADFMDYIIADRIVIPPEERAFYSEKVIYLPDSYYPTDDQQVIAETHTTRADFGLPADGFVFCCFNNTYKISPREFDIWMRVLRQVEGSVLWLLRSNQWSEANLSKEAAARGVNPNRLIFA